MTAFLQSWRKLLGRNWQSLTGICCNVLFGLKAAVSMRLRPGHVEDPNSHRAGGICKETRPQERSLMGVSVLLLDVPGSSWASVLRQSQQPVNASPQLC